MEALQAAVVLLFNIYWLEIEKTGNNPLKADLSTGLICAGQIQLKREHRGYKSKKRWAHIQISMNMDMDAISCSPKYKNPYNYL